MSIEGVFVCLKTCAMDALEGWCDVRFISHKDRVLGAFHNYRALVNMQQGKIVKDQRLCQGEVLEYRL